MVQKPGRCVPFSSFYPFFSLILTNWEHGTGKISLSGASCLPLNVGSPFDILKHPILTAARLAQLDKRRSTEREVVDNVPPLFWHL